MRFYAVVIFFSLLCWVWPLAQAQQFSRTDYREMDGLPSELVKGVTQDDEGLVWFATDEGFVRTDGQDFELYADGLRSVRAKSILIAGDGSLYGTTDEDFVRIDYFGSKKPRITRLGVEFDTVFAYPKKLYEDRQGNVWFSDNFALYRYDARGNLHRYELGADIQPQGENILRSCSFAETDGGGLYAISQTGILFRYAANRDEVSRFDFDCGLREVADLARVGPKKLLVSAVEGAYELTFDTEGEGPIGCRKVSDLYLARVRSVPNGGHYMAATWSAGLYRLFMDLDGYRFEPVENYRSQPSNDVFVADNRDVWLSTRKGASLFKSKPFMGLFQELTGPRYIQSLVEANGTGVVFSDGQTVYKVDEPSEGRFQARALYRLPEVEILQVAPVEDGYWLGCSDGLLRKIGFDGRLSGQISLREYGTKVFSLVRGVNGDLWACQDGNELLLRIDPMSGTVKTYGPEEGLNARPVVVRFLDRKGYVGCASSDSAYIHAYDAERDRLVNKSLPVVGGQGRRASAQITAHEMAVTDEGIWIGTNVGVLRLASAADSAGFVSLGNMSDEETRALTQDANGYLWLANARGLVRYEPQGGGYALFNESVGLPAKALSYRGITFDARNRVWVATVSEGVGFSDNKELSRQTVPPTFTSVTSASEQLLDDVEDDREVSVVSTSFLLFRFLSRSYPSKTLRYQVRLEGSALKALQGGLPGGMVPGEWADLPPRTSEHLLSDLPVGEYLFSVRAKQQGGYRWSEPTSFVFRVYQPYYQQWGVWVSFALFLGLVTLAVIRVNAYRLQREQDRLARLVNERTEELNARNEDLKLKNEEISKQARVLMENNEELQSMSEELHQNTEELLATQSKLEHSERLLRDNLEAISRTLAVAEFNGEGLFVGVNQIFLDLVGYESDELYGEYLAVVLPKSGPERAVYRDVIGRTREGENVLGVYQLRKKSGELRWMDASFSPVFNAQGELQKVVYLAKDVTDARILEEEAERTRRRNDTLFKLTTDVAADLDEQIQKVLAFATEEFGADMSIVSRIRGDKYTVKYFHPADSGLEKEQVFKTEETYCEIAMRSEGVLAIDHMGESEHSGHPCYSAFGLETYIGAQLIVNGKPFGTLTFSAKRPRDPRFSENDRSFMLSLTQWVSSAVQRSMYEKNLRHLRDMAVKTNDDLQDKNRLLEKAAHEMDVKNQQLQSMTDMMIASNQELEKKSKNIQDSIQYASRIQTAILGSPAQVERALGDAFVLFRPRDVVSGDFYWYEEQDGMQVIVAADCTGHGIPGAFMSMVGETLLSKIVIEKGVTNPEKILEDLHIEVRSALKQRDTKNRDGMDMAVCMIDPKNRKLAYAGAKNPLIFITGGKAEVVRGDKMPIGGEQHVERPEFTRHEFAYAPGDRFYIYSDGFQDQFGGEEGRKFMSRRFRKEVIGLSELPMQEQKAKLEATLDAWQGEAHPQVDDVLVIGVRLA